MDMQAQRQLAVTQQQAWEALNDPQVLKLCIPGCDRIEVSGENQYAIGLAVKIGPVAAKFAGTITLSDMQPPASYNIAFEGKGGPAGFGKGNAQVVLTSNEGGCELAYTVHASVGGKVAQLGQRLIDGTAKSMAEDFFKRFDEEMQRRFPQAYAAQAAADISALEAGRDGTPVPAAAAGGAAIPLWAWAAGIIVLATALVWWLR